MLKNTMRSPLSLLQAEQTKCPQPLLIRQRRAGQCPPWPDWQCWAWCPQDMLVPPGCQATADSYPTDHQPGPQLPSHSCSPPSCSPVHAHNQGCPVPGAESVTFHRAGDCPSLFVTVSAGPLSWTELTAPPSLVSMANPNPNVERNSTLMCSIYVCKAL